MRGGLQRYNHVHGGLQRYSASAGACTWYTYAEGKRKKRKKQSKAKKGKVVNEDACTWPWVNNVNVGMQDNKKKRCLP